ncbi:SDR family NAD(P)-dependent oxidoreductase [Iamia sp. SCSIO 61187]|uniref:SDR family oxidoreductase n=1 Tax=Iamia sp. SCSIO 61187 TaxID=2722752 RepID=UPI001C624F74|nr:SDR family NAD(P)-dependent oxidoreductase [Iamia sp. SCSIO 61187]QYG93916.1 SDR family NAD(P)-dependent oxidoreductase [Iamia sp. SCSIO 61187]
MTGVEVPDVEGRTVLATGASTGIGAGIAERLAARGVRLALCARTEPTLPDGATGTTASVDVTDADAVADWVDGAAAALGPLDLCIANAGILGPLGPLRDDDPDQVAATFRTNVEGLAHTAAAYARHVRGRPGGGAFLAISSGAGRNPTAGWAPYAASKAAVDALCRALAEEEADAPLRVLAVAPGVVDTGMQEAIRSSRPEAFPRHDAFVQMKADGAFNTAGFVADHLLRLAFGPDDEADVLVRLPQEQR